MPTPNKLEMGIIKLLLARLRSKSPSMYAIVTKIALALVSITGSYVLAYAGHAIPRGLQLFGSVSTDTLESIAITAGAVLTAVGFTTATTTTDPSLMSASAKQNVLDEAVATGTHIAVTGPNPLGPSAN